MVKNFNKRHSMKKFIVISLITCTSLFHNNALSMLVISKVVKDKMLLLPLVENRQELKKRNNALKRLLIKQNKVIKQLDKFDRPLSEFEYHLVNREITYHAEKLFELEQQIQE
jgi:hypothetical protein